MQPYLFPYLGYFQLIARVNRFVLLDAVQYIRHGWINRNRILKPAEGWQYFILPLAPHHQTDPIGSIQYQTDPGHRQKILRQLDHYKKRAPYFNQTMELLQHCMQSPEHSVARFNQFCLQQTCQYLGLNTPVQLSADLPLDYNQVQHAGQWALEITRQLGGTAYCNPVNGRDLFLPAEFEAAGIALQFWEARLPAYSQRRPVFEPGLSIVDAMMFNSPAEIRQMLTEGLLHDA